MTVSRVASTGQPVRRTTRISVIVPSYNSAAFLREALASAVDQVPPPHEVLVQDGGSTDATIEILESFGDRVDWVSKPDHGQSDALNKALERATGDVIIWLNADDRLVPGAIAAASSAFNADPDLAFVYGDFDIINSSGALMRKYKSSQYSWDRVFARGCYIFSGSLFIRKSQLVEIGGFDVSLQACMDLDVLLRLGAADHSQHLPQTIAQFRIHDASKSSNIGFVFVREALSLRSRYARRSPRLWLIALLAAAQSGLMEATAPLRYSSRWPRHGRSKTL